MLRLLLARALRISAVAVLTAAMLAACGTPLALRTEQAKASDCDLALLGGELVTSAKSGLAVRGPDTITEVIWPFGYTASRETTGVVLRDDTGKIVAHEGQRVT